MSIEFSQVSGVSLTATHPEERGSILKNMGTSNCGRTAVGTGMSVEIHRSLEKYGELPVHVLVGLVRSVKVTSVKIQGVFFTVLAKSMVAVPKEEHETFHVARPC